MDKPTAHLAPSFHVVPADDDDISRHPKVAQDAMEPHRLLGFVVDLGLNDKQVDIAMRIGPTTRVRTEQNHLCIGCGGSQAASRLGD